MNNSHPIKNEFNIDDLVNRIRHRAAMYTGGDSLQSLTSYLAGAEYVLYELNIDSTGIVGSEYFYKMLATKYSFGSGCIGWANIITAIALGYEKSNEINDWDNFNKNLSFEDK